MNVQIYEIFNGNGEIDYIATDCPYEILINYIAIHILEVHNYDLRGLIKHINQVGYHCGPQGVEHIDLDDEHFISSFIFALAQEKEFEEIAHEIKGRGMG